MPLQGEGRRFTFRMYLAGHAGGLPVQGLHKISMVLGSTADQMADLLPACTQMACWGVPRF